MPEFDNWRNLAMDALNERDEAFHAVMLATPGAGGDWEENRYHLKTGAAIGINPTAIDALADHLNAVADQVPLEKTWLPYEGAGVPINHPSKIVYKSNAQIAAFLRLHLAVTPVPATGWTGSTPIPELPTRRGPPVRASLQRRLTPWLTTSIRRRPRSTGAPPSRSCWKRVAGTSTTSCASSASSVPALAR